MTVRIDHKSPLNWSHDLSLGIGKTSIGRLALVFMCCRDEALLKAYRKTQLTFLQNNDKPHCYLNCYYCWYSFCGLENVEKLEIENEEIRKVNEFKYWGQL